MNKKLSTIIEYIGFIVKKYSEIQQKQMQNTFRVASIKKTANGTKIIFQVIGKATFMEYSPAEILSSEHFLEQFSKKDIQKITYAYAEDEAIRKNKAEEIKLIQQEFNNQIGKINFKLQDKDGNISCKTAIEIVKNDKLTNQLNRKDAMNIGYIAGYEHSQHNNEN